MAETTKRSELIRQQLQKLIDSAPPPVTQAERDKIASGRKGQKSIDEGRAAVKAREEEVRLHNESIERITKQLGDAETQEQTAGKAAEDAAAKAEREKNASPLTQKFLPFAGGAAAGGAYALGANATLDRGETSINRAINEIGDEIGPTEKLTHSQANRARAVGAANAAEQFKPASKLGKALKFGAKGAAYAVPSGLIFNEWHRYDEQAKDPNATQADRDMARAIANGLLGVGTGIGGEGAVRAFNTRVDEGVGRSMMRIETARELARRHDGADARRDMRPTAANAAALEDGAPKSKLAQALASRTIDAEVIPEPPARPALPAPQTPEPAPAAAPKPLNPGTAAYMRSQLKEFGVKGTSSMNKSALAEALSRQMAEHGAKRTVGKKLPKGTGKAAIPVAVGSYMAATGDSEAADATTAERAGNAATNFGVGAGAAYGGSKLVDALSKIAPMAMKAGGMGLSLLNPAMMTDMTDGLAEIPPEAIQAHDNAIFNRNARWLPEWMMTQSDMNAKEMAQVPTPSPERRSEGPRVDAAPEGPFGPRINQRIARMSSGGATPEQIANFLNQTIR